MLNKKWYNELNFADKNSFIQTVVFAFTALFTVCGVVMAAYSYYGSTRLQALISKERMIVNAGEVRGENDLKTIFFSVLNKRGFGH